MEHPPSRWLTRYGPRLLFDVTCDSHFPSLKEHFESQAKLASKTNEERAKDAEKKRISANP